MILLKGEGRTRLIVGVIGEPEIVERTSRSGRAFQVCDVGITSGVDTANNKSIYSKLKAYNSTAVDLARLQKGDFVVVVADEKLETWNGATGTNSKTVFEVRQFALLRGATSNSGQRAHTVKPTASAAASQSQPVSFDDLDEIEDDGMPF